MKSKKIIGVTALLIAVASTGDTVVNADTIGKGVTTKAVVMDTIKQKIQII